MLVQASKKMAKYLNEMLDKEKCNIDSIEYDEYTIDGYKRYVNSSYYGDSDYIISKNKVRVIRIEYKPECYSYPAFLSTETLNRIFNKNGADNFINGIEKYISI